MELQCWDTYRGHLTAAPCATQEQNHLQAVTGPAPEASFPLLEADGPAAHPVVVVFVVRGQALHPFVPETASIGRRPLSRISRRRVSSGDPPAPVRTSRTVSRSRISSQRCSTTASTPSHARVGNPDVVASESSGTAPTSARVTHPVRSSVASLRQAVALQPRRRGVTGVTPQHRFAVLPTTGVTQARLERASPSQADLQADQSDQHGWKLFLQLLQHHARASLRRCSLHSR